MYVYKTAMAIVFIEPASDDFALVVTVKLLRLAFLSSVRIQYFMKSPLQMSIAMMSTETRH